jgi:rhamnosyltransferase
MMAQKSAVTVGLVIPTLNAGLLWARALEAIKSQSILPDRLLVIDSGSTDGTAAAASGAGFEVIEIEKSQFNHGGTRQWAADYLSNCSIVIFMTQDAILSTEKSLERIVACFRDPTIALAYGRQLPREGAGAIESHSREFNYGPNSIEKNIATVDLLGTKVFFCSNSFAAYNRAILVGLGGFKRDLILGEDMEFAARAIKAGYTNVYSSDATVFHSHDYSLTEQFERYFDIGVFDEANPWMSTEFGTHTGEGLRFVMSEIKYLSARSKFQIVNAMLQTAAKLMGYRLGRIHRYLPKSLNRKLSMQPSYWR